MVLAMPVQEMFMVPVVSTTEPVVISKLPNATLVMDTLQASAIADCADRPAHKRPKVKAVNIGVSEH